MAKRNNLKTSLEIDPLHNISGIAYDMELQIQDAVGVTRTAQERIGENQLENDECLAALGLILYRLEQIQEGHALIVQNAPYSKYVPGEKGGRQ